MTPQDVCRVDDVPLGTALRLELDADDGTLVEVALVHAENGEFYAVSDVCSHGAVSLSEGEIEDCTLECWLHGSRFDLRTGAPLGLPATRPIPVYPVTVVGDVVFVDVDAEVATSPGGARAAPASPFPTRRNY